MALRPKTESTDNRTLRVGLLGGWHGLDPWDAQDLAGVTVRAQCFDTLYRRREGQLEPDLRYLAHGLRLDTIGVDGLPRYSMRLRDELRFADGSSIEPEDVAASLDRVAPLRAVAKISAAGGRRLQLSCLENDVVLEPHLGQIWAVIGKRGPKTWVGTGPFMIADEQFGEAGELLTLVRNRHWIPPLGSKPPTLERIVFHCYPLDAQGRPTALRDAVEAGEVDVSLMLPREVAGGLQGVRKIYQPGQSTAFLAFVCRRPWLSEVRVRRALSAAIDTWAVAKVCHDNPGAFAARGLLPPSMASIQRSIPGYDLEAAKRELAALAKPNGPLRMLTVWGPRPYLPNPRGVAEAIAAQLGKVGVGVTIETPASANEFFDAVRRGNHDLILSGYIAETPDAIDFLTALLSSRRIPRPELKMASTTNMASFGEREMDKRLLAAQKDGKAMPAVLELFEEQRPYLPLMYGANVAVHSWRIRNFELDPRGIPSFGELDLG
ncbi:ABC transporter substrate-binding protein [Nannocystaceae bacterium ST9]